MGRKQDGGAALGVGQLYRAGYEWRPGWHVGGRLDPHVVSGCVAYCEIDRMEAGQLHTSRSLSGAGVRGGHPDSGRCAAPGHHQLCAQEGSVLKRGL